MTKVVEIFLLPNCTLLFKLELDVNIIKISILNFFFLGGERPSSNSYN
jgi:hypothetical protein